MAVINFHQQKHHDFNLSSVWSPGVFLTPESKKQLSKMRDEGEPDLSLVKKRRPTGKGWPLIWNRRLKPTHRPSHCPQHIPIGPCLSPGNPKILTWSCNVPCGQTLAHIKAWELLSSLLQKCHSASLLSHYSFPIIENNTNIFNSSISGHRNAYWKKKKSYTYHAFTWLLWNQNRKSCILHKPANYFILITVIFTPWSLLTTKPCSVTIWELTHYSKLSPEHLAPLSTKCVRFENTVFGDETAHRQKQVCRW